MTALRSFKSSLTGLAATLTVAGGLTLAPTASQAGCFGCGFDVGVGIGGLVGALAAGSRANEPRYGYPDEPQAPRQRDRRRPPVVTYDPSDPEAPRAEAQPQQQQQRPAKRKAVAQKPAEAPAKKVATAQPAEGEAKKVTRSVAVANTGALEP
ncbi:hypothetical protein [uncultured Alsobacter sp.]|uniref:hypothetical protein n=1 Tax=uncultured Alsobacter sp. TaxID=1748258 RepID=UPI0025E83D87|nr:hypothetical protein [uncultured Alsobacter sp.]